MTCNEVTTGEVVEKYLLDQLSIELRDSFEQHYFECARCFSLLQTYRQMQAELASTRAEVLSEPPSAGWVWRWGWAPAMAVIVLSVTLSFLVRQSWNQPPSAVPRESPGPSVPAPGPSLRATMEDLARFDPPPYLPLRVRGAADEATARFQEAMKQYTRGDYGAAIPGLVAASTLDPEAPHTHFFLGISRLMVDGSPGARDSGARELGIESLRRTIALGDSAYRQDAHFYLAKAYLTTGNLDEAAKELTATSALRGDRAAEADRLLQELRAITPTRK